MAAAVELCDVSAETNLSWITLLALRPATRNVVASMLNGVKILPSPEGLPRDWRGLAHLTNVSAPPAGSTDPTGTVLNEWCKRNSEASLQDLETFLGRLDRWDIVNDVHDFLVEDAIVYLKQKENGLCPQALTYLDSDKHILTLDDVLRLEQGLCPQTYDAFLLYADEDRAFALEMLDRLENDYHLKLCLKERLIGGLTFEHDAIMQMISERCSRLVIVVSPAFLQSPENKHFVTFAQALGIEQRQRKVVPCLYNAEKSELPPELRYYWMLDYKRLQANPLCDFWDKLSRSIMAPIVGRHQPRLTLRELGDLAITDSSRDLQEVSTSPDCEAEVAAVTLKQICDKSSTEPDTPSRVAGLTETKYNEGKVAKTSTFLQRLLSSETKNGEMKISKMFRKKKAKKAVATMDNGI